MVVEATSILEFKVLRLEALERFGRENPTCFLSDRLPWCFELSSTIPERLRQNLERVRIHDIAGSV